MSLMSGGRINHELIDGTLLTLVGVVILTRHGGGKTDHSFAVGCHQYAESRLWWSFDRRTPGIDHLSQRHRGEHQLCKIGWPLDGPGTPLQLGDGCRLGGPREAYGGGDRSIGSCAHGRDAIWLYPFLTWPPVACKSRPCWLRTQCASSHWGVWAMSAAIWPSSSSTANCCSSIAESCSPKTIILALT